MSFVEKKIKQILTENNIEFEEFEHEAVYTSEQAVKVRPLKPREAGVKSMIFKTGEKINITAEQTAMQKNDDNIGEHINQKLNQTQSSQKLNPAQKFILVLNPGYKRIDTKKITKLENTKQIYLAKPEEVEKVAGVRIGCVAPFGLKTKLKTYLNEELLEKENLYFNPGLHTKTIKIKPADLLKVLENPVRFR